MLEDKKVQLQEIRFKEIEGTVLRAKVKWLAEGEKVAKYFCSLENRNFTNKQKHFPEKDNGGILADQHGIIDEVHHFYSDLYKHQDTEDVDLTSVKLEAPKLSQNDSNNVGSKNKSSYCLSALHQMKNDKKSRVRWFTTEFSKVFQNESGTFSAR